MGARLDWAGAVERAYPGGKGLIKEGEPIPDQAESAAVLMESLVLSRHAKAGPERVKKERSPSL